MVYAKTVLKSVTTRQFLDRALGIHALLNKEHATPKALTEGYRVSQCLLTQWGNSLAMALQCQEDGCVWLQQAYTHMCVIDRYVLRSAEV